MILYVLYVNITVDGMLLRHSSKIDYLKLSSTGRTEEIMAEGDDEKVLDLDKSEPTSDNDFQDSFCDPHDVKKAVIEDLEAEAEALALEERAARLKLNIKERKAAIAQLESQEKRVHFAKKPARSKSPDIIEADAMNHHPSQMTSRKGPMGPATHGADVNLGEFYGSHLYNNKPPYSDIYEQPRSTNIGYNPPPENDQQCGSAMMRLDINPQSYLFSPDDPKRGKHRAIVDFIPTTARTSTEDAVEEHEIAPGVTIKAGRQTRLDSITPAQWVAANSCILADIIRKSPDGNVRELVCDYMSYTTKIGELACKYTWKSVILYDNEYREKQHLFLFRWGSDSAHLHTVQLVPRKPTWEEGKEKKRYGGRSEKEPQSPKDSTKAPLCWNWNKEVPCTRSPCTYQHVCEWCKSAAHTRLKHDQPKKSA